MPGEEPLTRLTLEERGRFRVCLDFLEPLVDIAARHQPTRLYGSAGDAGFAEACWLICTGWSGRSVPKPDTLELLAAEWSLELDGTTELSKTMYGHDRLHLGRFALTDPHLMSQARDVMPAAAGLVPVG